MDCKTCIFNALKNCPGKEECEELIRIQNFWENKNKEENAELKAKNFELKESLKCFQTPEAIKALTFYITGEFELQEKKCIELEQENTRLKAENEILLGQLVINDGEDVTVQISKSQFNEYNKYRTTLQEIRAIAETPKPFIDFSETKTATEVGYDYAAICNELELRLYKVLELITKAEEE